jgi:hypothetical protein
MDFAYEADPHSGGISMAEPDEGSDRDLDVPAFMRRLQY